MATLLPPFRATDLNALYQKIKRGLYDPIPRSYSTDLASIIGMMLKTNPRDRLNCD